jgi:hypothetical protein
MGAGRKQANGGKLGFSYYNIIAAHKLGIEDLTSGAKIQFFYFLSMAPRSRARRRVFGPATAG